jgi:hypothetical protein
MAKTIKVGDLHIENSLANFLKKEGVLQEFVEETNRENDYDYIDSISKAFQWSLSKRGHNFWNNLEMKYLMNS